MNFNITTALFYMFSAVMLFGALRVVTSRNPVHSALYLVLTFVNAAGLWMLLEAEFLAIILVMVYVGAVMVLFLFVVMMLNINLERLREGFWSNLPLGILVGAALAFEMIVVLASGQFGLQSMPAPVAKSADFSNTRELAFALYTDYIYPFELVSLLLLVAMIIAVTLTLRKRGGKKTVDPDWQVSIKSKDRVELVSMVSETERVSSASDAASNKATGV